MEFEAIWNQEILQKVIVHLEYPEPSREGPEVFGRPLEPIPPNEANSMAERCVEKLRHIAEQRFRISPGQLEGYISLDKTGTQVYGIGMRHWLD